MPNADYPTSAPKYSDDGDRPLPTATLADRLRWAGTLTVSMGVAAALFIREGSRTGTVELLLIGVLCALFALYTFASGLDILAELRGRALVDADRDQH